MQPFPPPQIAANELRPGRHWYAIATAIGVLLIALGAALGVYRLSHAIDSVDTAHRFAGGDTVTLRLEAGSGKAIWVRDQEFGPSGAPECTITGPGDPGLADPEIGVFLTRDETWNPLYTIDVPRAGVYEVTCSPPAQSAYAIGDSGGLFALAGRLMAAVALGVLGIGVFAVIVLVTALRRRSHRKQLLAERHGSGDGHPAPR
ncbi:hypothetical protein [Streptomyces sp. NPDC058401]|uniref:hypothetical protein n=1 Tax=Streptomyces sp. NPDC058401 TaxID=3346480 RepID=UPI003651E778